MPDSTIVARGAAALVALFSQCPGGKPTDPPPPLDAGVVDVAPPPDVGAVLPPDAGLAVDEGSATEPDAEPAVDEGTTPPPDVQVWPGGELTPWLSRQYSYLAYSAAGGNECNTGSTGTIYTVAVRDEPVCVPADLKDLVAVPVAELSLCTPGAGCRECLPDEAACQPSSCFRPLEPAGCAADSVRLVRREGEELTTFVLFAAEDFKNLHQPKDGLPMTMTISENVDEDPELGNVILVAPPGQGPVVFGAMQPDLEDPKVRGDICDQYSMCGVLPFRSSVGYPFTRWSAAPRYPGTGLVLWSVY